MNSKFKTELSELVDNQIINKEVAEKIDVYFQSKTSNSPNRLFTIFGVLGSLLVGLGIILIFAHNWDDFSRQIKTGLAFLPLVIGQLCVGYSIFKKKGNTWKEASGTFLFFAVGSSIALVSQIYNIPGDLSSYILTWIVLCLPLIYMLRSNVLLILHLIYTTYYAFELGYSGLLEKTPWIYLLLIALIVPYYLQRLKTNKDSNITSIFNWLFPLSLTIALGTFVSSYSELGFLMYLLLFSIFYNIGKIPFFDAQKLRKNGYLIIGSLGIVIIMLTMSFDSFWYLEKFVFFAQESYISLTLFVLNLMLLGFAFSKGWIKTFNLFQYLFIGFSILYVLGLNMPLVGTVIVNVLILALGITTVQIGVKKFHFGIMNYGLLIIAALVVCRFFDTNISFVLRGLLFVGVGISFFLTNYIMLRKQKNKENLLK